MKTKLLISFLILAISVISCEKTELEFSCDPEINNYVKNNKKSFSNISLSEFNSYDVSLQRAVFNSWEPHKKRSAWLEKLNHILVNQELTLSEQDHVRILIEHISSDYYSIETLREKATSHSEFARKWISYSIEELGWSQKYIAFMVYRLYTTSGQIDQEISELAKIATLITTDSESSDCDCNTSVDYCNTGVCDSGNCNTTSGCGWLWSMECNGTCF